MKSIPGTLRNTARTCALTASLVIGSLAWQGARAAEASQPLSPEEATRLGTEAYVFGYPLVTMEMTRRVMTNVRAPQGPHAPMGQFARLRAYPTASMHDVTAPNADTLYTIAWLDVGKEPWVLSLPDAHGRYYLFPMLDAWTTVFEAPGRRTTGTGPQTYAITGPGWQGSLPPGVKQYQSPTSLVWILGRIYCSGTPEDYAAVHAMQDQCSVVPLSAYGKAYQPTPGQADPSIDMKTAVRDQVNALDAAQFFTLMASLLKANPPAATDAPMVAKLARLGIVPGQPFDLAKLDPAVQQALQQVPKAGVEQIKAWAKDGIASGDNKLENGWLFSLKTGVYGTNYLQRAFITAVGLGANRPEDAIYPVSQAEATGQPYSGANRYVLHFPKGQLPPVNGFWSLTMYDSHFFFVENPLNRYTLSERNQFATNPDGSVDLYLQHNNPGPDKESNWLPAPEDTFVLMLRLYWPQQTVLDGSWHPPGIQPVPLQPTGR